MDRAQLSSESSILMIVLVFHKTHRNTVPHYFLLLAFVLQQPDVAAIPKAVSFNHIDENLAALEVQLSEADMEQLADSFPSPDHKILMEKY